MKRIWVHSFFFSSSSSSSSDSDDSNSEPKKGKVSFEFSQKNKTVIWDLSAIGVKYDMFAESNLTDPSICAFHKYIYRVCRMFGGHFSYEFFRRYGSARKAEIFQ